MGSPHLSTSKDAGRHLNALFLFQYPVYRENTKSSGRIEVWFYSDGTNYKMYHVNFPLIVLCNEAL